MRSLTYHTEDWELHVAHDEIEGCRKGPIVGQPVRLPIAEEDWVKIAAWLQNLDNWDSGDGEVLTSIRISCMSRYRVILKRLDNRGTMVLVFRHKEDILNLIALCLYWAREVATT